MKRICIKRLFLLALAAVVAAAFLSCSSDGDGSGEDENGGGNSAVDSISWSNESEGTLAVQNNTDKDVILFQGHLPSATNIFGGIRANSSRLFDISDDVNDFDAGSYMILRGISKDEYEKNQQDFSTAKIEYSALVTYGNGKESHIEISPHCFGNYYYKVVNTGRIGIELRKDSPNGEEIGCIPAYTSCTFYADTSNDIRIFPVYWYYNAGTGEVIRIKTDNYSDSIDIAPRHITDPSGVTIILSASEDILDEISSL